MATLIPALAQRPTAFRAVGFIPIVGKPLCRRITEISGMLEVEKDTASCKKGLEAFSAKAEKIMRNSPQRDITNRSRLAAHYGVRLAKACKELGIIGADSSVARLMKGVAGCSKIGLYYVPSAISNYEVFWGNRLPARFLSVLRECYPDLSAAFLRNFDDGSGQFRRAMAMMRCQQVAYDGIGSFSSPSYPLFGADGKRMRGSDLPLEAQLLKLSEAFSAVLYKQFRPNLSDAEDECHSEVAAAAMIAVSGKDVDPNLTAVLLTVLFPPVPLVYAKIVVERLKHPHPKMLESVRGEDVRYAKEVVLETELFKILGKLKREGAIERRELAERRSMEGERERRRMLALCETMAGIEEDEDTLPGSAPFMDYES